MHPQDHKPGHNCHIIGYMTIVFIFIGLMLFLEKTLDNAYPLFALVITTGFYLHHVEVADQNTASGS